MPSYINTEFKNLMQTRTLLGRATRTSNIAKYNNGKKRVFCYAPPNDDEFAYTSKLGEYANDAGDRCIRTEDGKPIAFMMGDSHLHVLTRDEGIIEAAISDLFGVNKLLVYNSAREYMAQQIAHLVSKVSWPGIVEFVSEKDRCINVVNTMFSDFLNQSRESLTADLAAIERQIVNLRARLWLAHMIRDYEDHNFCQSVSISLTYNERMNGLAVTEISGVGRVDCISAALENQERSMLEIKNQLENASHSVHISEIPDSVFVVYRNGVPYLAWLIDPFVMSVSGRQYAMLNERAMILFRAAERNSIRTSIVFGDADAFSEYVHPHTQAIMRAHHRNLCIGAAAPQIASMLRATPPNNNTLSAIMASVTSSMTNYSDSPYSYISNFSHRIV